MLSPSLSTYRLSRINLAIWYLFKSFSLQKRLSITVNCNRKSLKTNIKFIKNRSGSDLLSHKATLAIPSALEDLTAVFEMDPRNRHVLCPSGH